MLMGLLDRRMARTFIRRGHRIESNQQISQDIGGVIHFNLISITGILVEECTLRQSNPTSPALEQAKAAKRQHWSILLHTAGKMMTSRHIADAE